MVFCPEENMQHILSSKTLETNKCDYVSDYVSKDDLESGKELVWHYKGVPCTMDVEVISVHGN